MLGYERASRVSNYQVRTLTRVLILGQSANLILMTCSLQQNSASLFMATWKESQRFIECKALRIRCIAFSITMKSSRCGAQPQIISSIAGKGFRCQCFFREANRKTHALKFNTQVLSKLSPPIRVKRYRWVSLIELRQFKSTKEEKKQIIQTSILSICY